ncbi:MULTISPECIES: HAD-IA family hydrolase [unclassified Phycicoccus]|jgi:sugar-phosphatase|uniref:HAD-IA family hydrolase n=1 Tax=unclassified Phycicoccus TaxID=2637926 RepID=UPI000703BA2D|nr:MULTISPECIES: HAD-IA family hydrolase [unclassified Phycicoccus]KQU68093.1 phosphatase [Phycicoccus sp. Root101]KQZ89972.1 phosphatase [Phycicoccus sp. Root563]
MPGTLGTLDGRDFAAVLFDMDGTLIDSIPVVIRSWLRWAEEEGVDPARLVGFHGVPARGIAEKLLPADRVDAAVDRIEAIETADTDGITVLPGTLDALATLTGADLCAIATSCTRPLADARIAATGLPAPRVVVTASDVRQGKPHPDPFLLAARLLGVDPRDCLVVEDAPGGLEAARAAGCATLAVTTTTAPADLIADAVVGTLADARFAVVEGRVRVTGVVTDA